MDGDQGMKNIWHETTINPGRHLISQCGLEYCGQPCALLHTDPELHSLVDCTTEYCGTGRTVPGNAAEGWAGRARTQYLALLDAGFTQYEATAILGYWLAGRTNVDASK